MLWNFNFGKWLSYKSWLHWLSPVEVPWDNVHPIQRFGIFTVFECTPPFNTEVILIYEWQNFRTCCWTFLNLLFFQSNYLIFRFGMHVVAKISCCIFQSFLNSWALLTNLKSRFIWETKHHLKDKIFVMYSNTWDLEWVKIQRLSDQFLAKTSTSVHFAPIG